MELFLCDKRLFSRANCFVEALNQSVNINTMSHSTLLDVFEVCSSAAEAAHASIDEYIDRVRIFLNDFQNAHIFGNCHII